MYIIKTMKVSSDELYSVHLCTHSIYLYIMPILVNFKANWALSLRIFKFIKKHYQRTCSKGASLLK